MLRKSKSLLRKVPFEERSSVVGMIPPFVVPRILTLLVVLLLLQGCMTSSRRPVVDSPGQKTRGVYHTVKRHQTLWRISKTYNVDMYRVARINGIRNVNEIKAGQKIFIPGAKKVRHVGIYIEDLGPSGRKGTKVDLAKAKGRFMWPVRGPIMKKFGRSQSRKHDGIDIDAARGTPIRAADSGKVIYSGDEIKGYGNIVIIKHGPTFTTVYAHNAANLVREGNTVKKGQVIARVGRSGRATGSHLHFEIRNHNKPIDPLLVLP
ncbi:MAG: peptidoglycan DD-metalloendopeptidase family protein [Proteobacteria bacterium]|nr:peptidoglycan DD-metalloendopeptidase family protein [Pseudomonadota bacterium]